MTRAPGKIIYRDHWDSHLVEIIDDGDLRSLYFAGNVLQSSLYLSNPYRLQLSYTRFMMAALMFCNTPERILMIGLGAGSMVHHIHHHFPQCHIDAVDNSPRIIDIAQSYFCLPNRPPVNIHCRDGFEFLGQESRAPYDIIFVDAFDKDGMSPTVYSHDFLHLCNASLAPSGLASLNIWSGDSDMMNSIKNGLSGHFSSVIELPVPARGNIVCLASDFLPLEAIAELDDATLNALTKRFGLNYKLIAKVWTKNNLGFRQRLARFFA